MLKTSGSFFAHLRPSMRCFVITIFALVLSIAGLAPSTALAAGRRHAANRETREPERHAGARRGARLHSAALETRRSFGRAAAHVSARSRGRHRQPHTAQAIHRARRHGTEAVREAARQAALEAAQDQTPAEESKETASLALPAVPLHYVNLPPLRGSHESLVRQNQRAEQEGLLRIEDDAAIASLRRTGSLVVLPVGEGLRVDERLPDNRRYCREWTGRFLTDLARVHYSRFHTPLQVNSAVRTVEYQRHLLRINGNAAPAEGDVASPHLTGATIDIAKKGLSPSEVSWMRAYLYPLQASGRIDVEEEFHQSCFHVTVYKSYANTESVQTVAQGGGRNATSLLASRMR